MTQSPEKAPNEGRAPDGRFAPGNTLGTPFGPENPPPRSPGRPKKDAWVGALEAMLAKEDRMSDALAARLMKIALKGRDGDALKALEMIQTRVGGPVTQRVEAEVVSEARSILIVGYTGPPPALPAEVRELERLRGEAEEQAQINRDQAR